MEQDAVDEARREAEYVEIAARAAALRAEAEQTIREVR
jgi:hypothetical protein